MMKFKGDNYSPQQDTGWGVIYRLNDLFREVEALAPAGQYDKWNFKLDRIWSNLCYRNPLKVTKDDEGNIISIEYEEEKHREKLFLDKMILKHKSVMATEFKKMPQEKKEKKSKEYILAKKNLYKAIMLKEVWLRKYMYELKLYLKELEHNPAGAMFGRG